MPSSQWDMFLDSDEAIVWEGAPRRSVFLLSSNDLILIPFSLLWAGFALFWNLGVWNIGAPFYFKLFGLPFLVAGAYITVGRFFVSAAARRRTRYALSNKRAFIATSLFSETLQEMPITKSMPLELVPGTNGKVTLGPKTVNARQWNASLTWSGKSNDFAFENIGDAQSVYQMIRNIQRGDDENAS
ncbi:hypothetical protein ACMU_10275 [Actibacterium mucosum KCTC 23349]|uniref:DUF304 domain-containing protein n=2 Tax=Actibacterium TaxID=1433986 RepID=A0A037ZKQ2_9RHOB|nr:hypothetical protein ACMU_10275 [Actibacterium mucosum KCTC 23349]